MQEFDSAAPSSKSQTEHWPPLRFPRWLVGVLVLLCVSLTLGFYIPLKKTNDKQTERLRLLAREYHLATAAFEESSKKLRAVSKQRDGLQNNLGEISDAESSAIRAVTELYGHLEEALKLQIERKQLRLKKGERSVAVVLDSLFLVYPHKTFVHPPGDELLCQVARALPKNTKHPTQVVAHANGERPSSRLLEKNYESSWQLSSVMAAEVAMKLQKCGIAGVDLRATGAAHFEGQTKDARRSTARFEIFVYPADE